MTGRHFLMYFLNNINRIENCNFAIRLFKRSSCQLFPTNDQKSSYNRKAGNTVFGDSQFRGILSSLDFGQVTVHQLGHLEH